MSGSRASLCAVSDPGDRLATSVGRALLLCGLVLLCVSVGVPLSLDAAGALFQILGIFVTALGVAVVPGWLAQAEAWLTAQQAAVSAKRAALGAAVRGWRARRRGVPHVVNLTGSAHARGTASATVTVERGRVDRDSIDTRAWLAHLDDRLYWLVERVDKADAREQEARAAFEKRLGEQDAALRAHTIIVATRGWQFIVAGLGCSLIGTALTLAAV